MGRGLVRLAETKAKILPLKACSSRGTGNLSNMIAALYYDVQHQANVVNMSFDVSSPSPALNQAIAYANQKGVVLVAAAENENTNAPLHPAALKSNVMGIASTTHCDQRSAFLNHCSTNVWDAPHRTSKHSP